MTQKPEQERKVKDPNDPLVLGCLVMFYFISLGSSKQRAARAVKPEPKTLPPALAAPGPGPGLQTAALETPSKAELQSSKFQQTGGHQNQTDTRRKITFD